MISRRFTQISSLLFLHSSWGPEVKWFCNPVLSCHSCVLSWFTCPVGVFVQYSGLHLFPFLALGTALLIGVLFGRLFCGWVCPFGFIQDLLYKLPVRKIEIPRKTNLLKYFVLAIGVFAIPFFLGEETFYSFCRICPASALQVTIPNLVMSGFVKISISNFIKISVLIGILFLTALNSRAFCKTLCPIGALLAPLNMLSFRTVNVSSNACISCKKCDEICPTQVKPSGRINEGIPASRAFDCIVCSECKKVCPKTKSEKGV
jgi:ferredoxin-type protein NapH